jgi:predicted DNA-binding transcriptional regulator AlpA
MSSTSPPEAPIEVLGVSEIGKLLGISRQAADEASRRPGFPEPYAIVQSRRRFWLPEEVEEWIAARRSKSTNGGP